MERVHELKVHETKVQETKVHELNQLRGFQVVLSSFLKRFSESQSDRIDLLEGIEQLDRIVAESGSGKTPPGAVDEWMKSYMPLAKRSSLAPEDRERISALLLELQRSSDGMVSDERMNAEVNSLAKLRQKITDWRTRSEAEEQMTDGATSSLNTAPLRASPVSVDRTQKTGARKIILKRRSETEQPDHTARFIETLWSELEYFEQDMFKGQHALSRLNDMLNCAETKIDPMYLHLAGSFIYFLSNEGYKMAPYVKRLRHIEKIREKATAGIVSPGQSSKAGVTP